MSDPEDVKALKAGAIDLVHRDLRGINLSDADYSGRDFSEAHIEGVNFDRCNLSGSVFTKCKSSNATFKESDLSKSVFLSTAVVRVSFEGANLDGADLARSHFAKSDFSNCNLSDTNFQNTVINEGCKFDNCVTNTNTLFDGASIFRPLSHLPAFRFYKVERGKLVRKNDNENSVTEDTKDKSAFEEMPVEPIVSKNEIRDQTFKKIAVIEEKLDELYELGSEGKQLGGIGHNNPPEAVPMERSDISVVLQSAREVAEDESTENATIETVSSKLAEISATIFKWVANKFDVAATEFSKQIGKTLASKSIVAGVGIWIGFSNELQTLSDFLQLLLK